MDWGYVGLYRDNGTEHGNYYRMIGYIYIYWRYVGIMENRMETTVEYWGYAGIMENKMATTVVYWGHVAIMEKKMETIGIIWG